MEPNHLAYRFDKNSSHLFPLDYTCRYCRKVESDPSYYNVILPVTKVAKSRDFILLKSIQYNQVKILIPRCQSCNKVHDKTSTFTKVIMAFIYIITSALSIYLLGLNGIFVAVFLPALMVFIYEPISKIFLDKHNVKSELLGFNNEPIVQELKGAGWELGKPT